MTDAVGDSKVFTQLGAEWLALAAALPVPVDRSFSGLYGLEILEIEFERVVARVSVRDEVKQPMGLLNGGVYAAMAEDMTSLATGGGVHADGKLAVGQSNNTSFLRPIKSGYVHGEATVLHRGRTTWVWDVRFYDDERRLCATSRVTVATPPAQEAAGR
jgi:1,4-dihydroxy-2-naphthoyl-CoA hydrolase